MLPIIETVSYKQGVLSIIDQRILPAQYQRLTLKNEKEVFEAIQSLAVRGAPAIGICAAYGVALSASAYSSVLSGPDLRKKVLEVCDYLSSSRPTAVNLFYALEKCRQCINANPDEGLVSALESLARDIHKSDLAHSAAMAASAEHILAQGSRVLTHCNTGALATGGGGTALGLIFAGFEQGLVSRVWVDETRPLLQGARLTAWELGQKGVPYTLICDNMAAMLMARGEVDSVIVGADRIAANGDFANKIGTYSLAVLAQYHHIPFYTVAPSSTFDLDTKQGADILIEERQEQEVKGYQEMTWAPRDAAVFNPAFDVTPAVLLSGIVCEKGLITPPFKENIIKLVGTV